MNHSINSLVQELETKAVSVWVKKRQTDNAINSKISKKEKQIKYVIYLCI